MAQTEIFVKMEEGNSSKRPRTTKGAWIDMSKKKVDILTLSQIESIFCNAFDVHICPEWHIPEGGNGLHQINGMNSDTGVRVIMNYWPSTGAVLFQGKPKDVEVYKEKWPSAKKLLGFE